MTPRELRLDLIGDVKSHDEYMARVREVNLDFKISNDFRMMYLRDRTNKPFGLLIGWKDGDKIRYTGSLCHPNDKWDRELAFFYAITNQHIPERMLKHPHLPGMKLEIEHFLGS